MTKQKRNKKEITEDEFSEWKGSKVTQRLFELLAIEVEMARVNIVEATGTVEERGMASLKNGVIAAALEQLIVADLEYFNSPLHMEDI